MDRPVIDHIIIDITAGQEERRFLPVFDELLAWAEEVRCPAGCAFRYHAHPMVRDDARPGYLTTTFTT